jgi:sulfide:quinone oxidoreductase
MTASVLVAGGGVAGLEAVLALRALVGDRARVELLAPERAFTYRPLSVTEPFTPGRTLRFPLADIAADLGVPVHRDALASVRPGDHAVETQDGRLLGYDALVLALGARRLEGIPGALTFRGPVDAPRVAGVVGELRDGAIRRVVFAVPAGTTWALPIYELVLHTAAAVRSAGPVAEIVVVTPEPAPLAAFGAAAGELVSGLLAQQRVRLVTGARARAFSAGRLDIDGRPPLPADRVIALPRLAGPRPRGLPCDPLGFVAVDDRTRVLGLDAVHAVGDAARQGVKQGGLATQQADLAARVIAHALGAAPEPPPYVPTLRGLLLTGDGAWYLRRDAAGGSEVSSEPLWWPPAKIAGRHLGPYLASHLDLALPPAPGARDLERLVA